MLVRDGFGHERDSQDDDTGGDEQDDGEVEVVDAAYDGGTVAGDGAAARPVDKLCDHSGEADQEAEHEAPKCTLKEVRMFVLLSHNFYKRMAAVNGSMKNMVAGD